MYTNNDWTENFHTRIVFYRWKHYPSRLRCQNQKSIWKCLWMYSFKPTRIKERYFFSNIIRCTAIQSNSTDCWSNFKTSSTNVPILLWVSVYSEYECQHIQYTVVKLPKINATTINENKNRNIRSIHSLRHGWVRSEQNGESVRCTLTTYRAPYNNRVSNIPSRLIIIVFNNIFHFSQFRNQLTAF